MSTQHIKTVGIAGAGTMGHGIAQLCATAGFNVLLFDVTPEAVLRGIHAIENALQKSVEKNKLTADVKNQALSRIKPCHSIDQLQADLIIEAIVEKLEVKRQLFQSLEANNHPHTILASNTSSISITQIAASLTHRSRIAGLHFFNPAPLMKLVEIVQGVDTANETISTLKNFAQQLGKTPVVAKDSPGFIVNRVARHYYVEALKMLEEKNTDIKTIDSLLRASGFKMGAFELMDLIGNDINFSVTTSLFEAFHFDPKFRPSRIQQQEVDAGHLGKKSGKGFYDYMQIPNDV